jgi:hypothetical protein
VTEHSEPRRWTLRWSPGFKGDVSVHVRPIPALDEPLNVEIRVREDTATKADVEAVAHQLVEIAPDGDMFTRKSWCEAKAHIICSTIFKEGGEGS